MTNYTNRKQAVRRQDLCNMLGLSDRAVRRMIEELRLERVPILSTAHGSGYWMSKDPVEINMFIAEQKSRIKSAADVIHSFEAMMKDNPDQMRMEVL